MERPNSPTYDKDLAVIHTGRTLEWSEVDEAIEIHVGYRWNRSFACDGGTDLHAR